MAKKKRQPNTVGKVGGYVRKSDAIPPDDCVTLEQKRAYVDDLIRVRMSELVGDAARDGETIDVWYVDMGISGRGEFLDKRLDFEKARVDAKEGRLRLLYSRDLSRLFRDLVQQEIWFGEMESFGCVPRIQDLPFIADEATRVLLRQQLGSLNQYMAVRTGALRANDLRGRVENRIWVGRQKSQFGLIYNQETKGFDLDPATADFVSLVFETFIACHGIGLKTAKELNRLLDTEDPRAMRSATGKLWNPERVLYLIRSPLYRRETTINDLRIAVPSLIPEIIDPALTAEADRLLTLRAPIIEGIQAKIKASRIDYTYGALLRCGFCGGRMRAYRYPSRQYRPDLYDVAPGHSLPPPQYIAWDCSGDDDLTKPACRESSSVQQFRIDALVGQGVQLALDMYAKIYDLAAIRPNARKTITPVKDSLEGALLKLDERRRRYHDLYAAGVIKELATVQSYIQAVDQEQSRLENQHAAVDRPPDVPADMPRLTFAEWERLLVNYAEVWGSVGAPGSVPDQALDITKHQLLKALGATIHVRPLPREPKQRAAGNMHGYGGTLAISIDLHALGFTGPTALALMETEEAFREYKRWRARGLKPGPDNPHNFKKGIDWTSAASNRRLALAAAILARACPVAFGELLTISPEASTVYAASNFPVAMLTRDLQVLSGAGMVQKIRRGSYIANSESIVSHYFKRFAALP